MVTKMRYIIDMVPETSEEAVSIYMAEHGCEIVQVLSNIGLIYVVEADEAPPVTEIVEEVLVDDPSTKITLLEEEVTTTDLEIQANATNDEDNWWKLAVIPNIDLDSEEFKIVRAADNTRVYLLDSGIEHEHAEFVGKKVTLLHSMTADFVDAKGHGTALASIIVGDQCGITNADLRVAKIFDTSRPTLVSDILAAFDAVLVDHRAAGAKPAVMNLSWAINKNTYVENKIRALMAEGILVCVAAGNSGMAIEDVTPAAMPEVVTVGSFGPNLIPSDFSNYTGPSDTSYTAHETNYGPGLDIFAPGEAIRVAKLGGGLGYTAGTSAASAVASACASISLARLNLQNADLLPVVVENFTKDAVIKDMLTLEGNYELSPNAVVRATIKEYDGLVNPLTVAVLPTHVVEIGKEFRIWAFDPTTFNSARVLDDLSGINGRYEENYIVGTVPVGSPSPFVLTFTQEATDGTSTLTSVAGIIGYDSAVISMEDAVKNAGLHFLAECDGCAPDKSCCTCGDVKTGCLGCEGPIGCN